MRKRTDKEREDADKESLPAPGTADAATKDKLWARALGESEKEFGQGSVQKMDDAPLNVDVIPTGSYALDKALGVGGLPRGRMVELFGPEGSGKTTIALHVIAEAQRLGGRAVFIDAEHALDKKYATQIGIDLSGNRFAFCQPDTGEQGLNVARKFLLSGVVDVIVIDSVAALVPQAEIDGDIGQQFMGLQARLISQSTRILSGDVAKTKTLLIFINQIREKIGVVYGNPEVTPGGRALKFYSSVRLDVRPAGKIEENGRRVGHNMLIKVIKNKVAVPFAEAETRFYYGRGICKEFEVLNLAIEGNIVAKSGAWLNYGDEKLGQGMDAAMQYLAQNPATAQKILHDLQRQKAL